MRDCASLPDIGEGETADGRRWNVLGGSLSAIALTFFQGERVETSIGVHQFARATALSVALRHL